MPPIEEGDPIVLLIVLAASLLMGAWVQQWLNPPSNNGTERFIQR